jgi:PAS domain-containing protein
MQHFVLTENVRLFRRRLAGAEGVERRRLEAMLAAAERELALFDAKSHGARPPWWDATSIELEALRVERIAWFKSQFADAPSLAALIDPSAGLPIVDVNKTYERATGMAREEIVGRLLFDLFPDNPNDPAADGVSNLYASLHAVAETGQPHEMKLQRYDTQDAQGVWRARYWRPVNRPLCDDSGRLILLLNVVDEVSGPSELAGSEQRNFVTVVG